MQKTQPQKNFGSLASAEERERSTGNADEFAELCTGRAQTPWSCQRQLIELAGTLSFTMSRITTRHMRYFGLSVNRLGYAHRNEAPQPLVWRGRNRGSTASDTGAKATSDRVPLQTQTTVTDCAKGTRLGKLML